VVAVTGLTTAQVLELAVRRGTWVAVRLRDGRIEMGVPRKISTPLGPPHHLLILRLKSGMDLACWVDEIETLWGAETEEELARLTVPQGREG